MKKKLIIYNVVVTVVVLALMFGFGIMVTNSNNYDIMEKKIKEITAVYVANYDGDISIPEDDEVRVTVIDSTGKVIKDNGTGEIEENHLYREEIQAAAAGDPTVVVRNSETLGKEMMYYAEAVKDDGGEIAAFIRVAIPTEDISAYAVKSIVPMIIILLAVWLCSIIASVLLSGVLLKPLQQVKSNLAQIENGTYQKIAPTTGDSDMNEILSGINDLSEQLQTNIASARGEKQKLDYILSNISDGIAVLDGDLNIVIANETIKSIFGVTEAAGRSVDVLTADSTFISAVKGCAEKKSDAIFGLQINSLYYLCSVRYTQNDMFQGVNSPACGSEFATTTKGESPLGGTAPKARGSGGTASPGGSPFIIAVLTDVTQEKIGEKMRLEFFANASHELKTPLTAIKGFNDMITLQCKDKTISGYSEKIGKEIDRVINLLGDMLDLSKLENSSLRTENLAEIDLAEIANEVKDGLSRIAEERQVEIFVSGGGTVKAEREHIYELIKNLAENGVRYNNAGGRVDIKIESEGGRTKLTVADNGIGIDRKHQSRIFERFYRVDKSRSRATGGTGLGLAIVKHICELYNADLTLNSKLGDGTSISVTF